MRIDVEHIPEVVQPYRARSYEANITVTGSRLSEGQMRDLARAVVRGFRDPDPSKAGTMDEELRTKLRVLELKSSEQLDGFQQYRQVWYVKIQDPYLD